MFDTAQTDYDIVDATPFGRDPLRELAGACAQEGLGLGFYYSLLDWRLDRLKASRTPSSASTWSPSPRNRDARRRARALARGPGVW